MVFQDLKEQIVSSYESVTPDCLDIIKLRCIELDKEAQMIDFPKKNNRFFNSYTLQLISIAAAIILVCLTCFSISRIPSNISDLGFVKTEQSPVAVSASLTNVIDVVEVATIYFDVNPSFEIKVDEKHKVISVSAANEDAKKLIDELHITGVDAKIAINSIVGTLYLHGYLVGDTAAILVSVDATDKNTYDELSKDIEKALNENETKCEVIIQSVDAKKYNNQANENHISVGKMELIDEIIEISVDYTAKDVGILAKKSIYTLNNILKEVSNESSKENNRDKKIEDKKEETPKKEESKKEESKKEEPQANQNQNKTEVPKTNDATNNVTPGASNNTTNIVDDTTDIAVDVTKQATDTAIQIVDITTDAAFDIVDSVTDTSINVASEVTDTALDVTNEVTDTAFDITNEVTDTAVDIVEDVTNSVDQILKGIFK